ncbi:MAG: hypothetical protein ABII68_01925 [Pseudomonadota bacterium]
MNYLLNCVSEALNIPPDHIINMGIKSFLERQIRLAELDIADLREKYLVSSKEELEKKIKNNEVYSHPAWEDLIAWENTENHICQLKAILKKEWDHVDTVQTD